MEELHRVSRTLGIHPTATHIVLELEGNTSKKNGVINSLCDLHLMIDENEKDATLWK